MKKSLKKTPFYHLYKKIKLRRRSLRKYPNGITIEPTNRCNLICNYCPKSKLEDRKEKDIDFDLFKKIIDEAGSIMQLQNVALTGYGEPLLYPKLIDSIKYIKEKYPKAKVYITTNGILLTKGLGKKIIESGLDQMTISINFHSKEKYKKNSGKDLYETAFANTLNFLKILNDESIERKPLTYVQILDKLNDEEEIREFENFWSPLLAPNARLQIQSYVNWGGVTDLYSEDHRYPCAHIENSWIITNEGNAIACCMAFPKSNSNLILGNLKEKNLEELYINNEKIKKLRRMNVENKLENIPECKCCDAWKTYPNIRFKNPLGVIQKRKWI